MAVIDELKQDPKFLALSPEAKRIVLSKKDPAFGRLSSGAQGIVVSKISATTGGGSAEKPSFLDKTISALPRIGQAAGTPFGPIGELIGRGAGEAAARNPQVTKPLAKFAMSSAPAVAGMVASPGVGPATAAAMTARAAMEIKDKGSVEGAENVLKESVLGRGPLTAAKELAIKNPASMAKIAGEGLLQHVAEVPALVKAAMASGSGLKAAKALGATKAYLNSAKKMEEAAAVGKTMLDEQVITAKATAQEMAEKVEGLITEKGQAIGNYLDSVGAKFNLKKIVNALEEMRPRSASGKLLDAGKFKAINGQIDEAVATVNSYGSKLQAEMPSINPKDWKFNVVGDAPLVDFSDANQLKRAFQETTNWYGKAPADVADRVIAGKVRALVDDSLEEIAKQAGKGNEYAAFLKDKKVYSHAMRAKDYLYNRLSSEIGNKTISLTDWSAILAGAVTGGNPITSAGTLAAKKITEKYGNQMLSQVRNAATTIPSKIRMGLIPAEGFAGNE